MTKYFLAPLIASFSLCILFIPVNLFKNWEIYSELDRMMTQIALSFFFTPFVYVVALPIHGIGCVFMEMLKFMQVYNLIFVLVLGFVLGLFVAPMMSSGRFDSNSLVTGLSGMVSAWSYYIFDKREQKREKAVAE